MTRLSELQDAKVVTLDGVTLGRVHEVHCEGGQVVAIICGPGSFIERLTARRRGRPIPWDCVRKMSNGEIIVTPKPPKRKRR